MTTPERGPAATASAQGKWDDLARRIASGAVVTAIGFAAIWAGGPWLAGLVALTAGTMVWELVRMLGGVDAALPLALVSGGLILLAAFLPPSAALPLLLAPAMVSIGRMRANRALGAVAIGLIMLASFGLITLRDEFGILWMAWLIAIVAATDVFGYFFGKLIGGPKFWPRVSPKKTWSGTLAGWTSAALIGAGFWVAGFSGPGIVATSVSLSMASQLGDIAESAIKRQMGVKDSSSLLPGHGGVFDRFDGVLGASVFLLVVEALIAFPPPVS